MNPSALTIRSQIFGYYEAPPTSAVETARITPLLFGREPSLMQRVVGALVVFVFREGAIEYWEIGGLLEAGVHMDDAIRAVAAHGERPVAILQPAAYLMKDDQGRRIEAGLRVLTECRRRRAELRLNGAAGQPLDRFEAVDLGRVNRGWIGVPPPPGLRLEAVGPVGIRPEAHEA